MHAGLMGMISHWMTDSVLELEPFVAASRPLSLAAALTILGLRIERVDDRWVLFLQGFPREWHATETEAVGAAQRWQQMEPTIELTSGPTWLVYGGDQYLFSSTSREEAEGFVQGIAVGKFMESVRDS
jgi:hypothetical protein